jgi:hypothetical protein
MKYSLFDRITRTLRIHYFGLAAVALAGCLPSSESDEFVPMCHTTADCAAGKTCDEGICWGNPPDGQFAAVLVPPSEGWPDLATTEIPALSIAADGWIENLGFAETATIAGRVVLACGADVVCEISPDVSIDAQVTFSRPSSIAGRPDYTRTVTSVAGMTGDDPSFTVALPLSDVPYQVLVVPGGSGSSTPAGVQPSELAPPLRTELEVSSGQSMDRSVEWAVGDPLLHKLVTGQVTDVANRGMAGMQVVAQARPMTSTGRSSSVATTDAEGAFSLRIPLGLESSRFDLVVTPVEPGAAPTLVVSEVEIPDPVSGEPFQLPQQLLQMPSVPATASFTIPVRGRTSTGDEVPVRGAAVRMSLDLPDTPVNTRATFSASTFTDDNGNAVLDLLPGDVTGNRVYTTSIEPLPSSEHATVHGHRIEVGPGMGLLASIQLERRIAVGGAVYGADGLSAYHAMVAAKIAPAFRDALSAEARAMVDNLQLPSASTDVSGRFVLWLDDELVGQTAVYDLEITPADPLMPLWTVRDLDMSARSETGVLELAGITLPAASYARGLVFAPEGAAVPQAGLRLYEILDTEACVPGPSCPLVVFRGLATSREDGLIRLILPDERADERE